MSLMGSLYIGASGLQTGQNALNTTAHNMSNVDTVGYTRQMVMQATRQYNTISESGSAVAKQQLGLGVVYAETKTIRDVFLDKAYRRESGRSAFYEVSTQTVEEMENLLQELDGEDFGTAMDNLWSAVQDMANDPAAAATQNVFVSRCYEFLARANAVYQGLSDYQDNINASIKTDVERINTIGQAISELNFAILRVESGKMERANDLRDARNQLLDELGSLANISYYDDAFGNVNVRIEGNDFVKTDSVNEISLYTDNSTGFYTPYWRQLANVEIVNGEEKVDIEGAHVFNMLREISPAMNTDIGGVKAKILARGDHRATYEDVDMANPANPTHYDQNISQSLLMNVQAEFDQLIHKIAMGINEILETAANDAGAYPDSTYLRDSTGAPLQVFDLTVASDGYTVQNMTINSELRQAPTLLGFYIIGDTGEARATTGKIKDLFSALDHVLNPNTATKVNLAEYYNSLVSQVGNTGLVSREILANQEKTVEEVAAAREQVVGVSTDEELSNMIMFQNAYNASSRYINVISEMLEHIITTLGH